MRSGRKNGHLRIDFDLFDCGFFAAFGERGRTLVTVYQVLRRLVWRSEDEGRPEWRDSYKQGYMVCWASRSAISEIAGLAPSKVSVAVAELEQLGWVNRTSTPYGNNRYVLGHLSEVDERDVELFYADMWLSRLVAFQHALAKRIGLGRIQDLPISDRIDAIRQTGGAPWDFDEDRYVKEPTPLRLPMARRAAVVPDREAP